MKQIAIFASGEGTNAKKIIEYLGKKSNSTSTVSLIVCSKAGAGVLSMASENNIASIVIEK